MKLADAKPDAHLEPAVLQSMMAGVDAGRRRRGAVVAQVGGRRGFASHAVVLLGGASTKTASISLGTGSNRRRRRRRSHVDWSLQG